LGAVLNHFRDGSLDCFTGKGDIFADPFAYACFLYTFRGSRYFPGIRFNNDGCTIFFFERASIISGTQHQKHKAVLIPKHHP
jgi:hypothetical protein